MAAAPEAQQKPPLPAKTVKEAGDHGLISDPYISKPGYKYYSFAILSRLGYYRLTMNNEITLSEAISDPAGVFDRLNYCSYRSHRERLVDWSAARVGEMFVKLGIGTADDVARWEARYQQEAK